MPLPAILDPSDRYVTGWSLPRAVVARLVRWRKAFLANRLDELLPWNYAAPSTPADVA